MEGYQWIKQPNEVEEFINRLFGHFINSMHGAEKILESAEQNDEVLAEGFRVTYRAGYCWHFAHMLEDVFSRGRVCWAAPFSHIVWVDEDGVAYDVEGKYDGEAFYFIPEDMCGDSLIGFRHCGLLDKKDHYRSKEELILLIKEFCQKTRQEYNSEIEDFLCDKETEKERKVSPVEGEQ